MDPGWKTGLNLIIGIVIFNASAGCASHGGSRSDAGPVGSAGTRDAASGRGGTGAGGLAGASATTDAGAGGGAAGSAGMGAGTAGDPGNSGSTGTDASREDAPADRPGSDAAGGAAVFTHGPAGGACPVGGSSGNPLPQNATATLIRGGFSELEGPVWVEAQRALYFCEMGATPTTGSIHKCTRQRTAISLYSSTT